MIKYQNCDTPPSHKEKLRNSYNAIPLLKRERGNILKRALPFSILLLSVLSLLTLSACLPGGTPSRGRGWSGPLATEQRAYLTTEEGKLEALNLSARSRGLI